MFQLIGYIYNNTLTLFTLDAYILNKYHLGMKTGICSKKKEPFVPLLSEFTQERATPSAELEPYNAFALEENRCPKKPGQQTLQLQRSVVRFGFCTSLQCFWVQFHQPHILACELGHESVFQDHQPPYISFQSSSSFISSPFKIFGFKVLGLNTPEASSGSIIDQNIAGGQQWNAGLQRRSSLQDFFFSLEGCSHGKFLPKNSRPTFSKADWKSL